VSAGTWLNNWAADLLKLGRPLDAEKLLRRSMELEQTGSSEDAVSPMGMSNYALSLLELARTDEAASYAERAYQGGTKQGNPIVINQARLRLARAYRAQHDLVRSIQVLDDAELSMRKLLPGGHFAFAALAAERALTLQEQGDAAGALKLINEAIQIDEQAAQHGKAGAQYLPTLLTYRATFELTEGQLPAAEADVRRALSLLSVDAQPGDYSVYSGRAQLILAQVLIAEGRPSEARSSAQAAAAQLEKAVGPDHPDTRAARDLCGICERSPT
jgi:tetratricopeptide (TPR) repeat protein